ncbi:DUF2760 domain-containing protein [Candidatus Methylospira mobilis]|uniref:DUF2760 domain-containing protein n=2 Tax=Candidatus Methylospira mobilis TaxID=1808979 RepID=A0A5Q0BN76_9GAMM|nr:DUF2760 domain-containing protein [Candidatus Methylospira mobilis]
MKIDLNLIPTTFDAIHAALAMTVAGLFFLLILLLILALLTFLRRKNTTDSMPELSATAAPVSETPSASNGSSIPEKPVQAPEIAAGSALQLLALLQQEARFVDFLQENVAVYSDQEIGAAARVVHDGCVKIVRKHFDIRPVYEQSEGSSITLPPGFDASSTRLIGNVVGHAPFTGTLVHRGYRATRCELPHLTAGHDPHIIAAAEVEL